MFCCPVVRPATQWFVSGGYMNLVKQIHVKAAQDLKRLREKMLN